MNVLDLWKGLTQFQQSFSQKLPFYNDKNRAGALLEMGISRQASRQGIKKAPENLVKAPPQAPAVNVSFSGYGKSQGIEGRHGNITFIDGTGDPANANKQIKINHDSIRLIDYDTTEDEAIRRQKQQAGPAITQENFENGLQIKLGAPTREELDAYREVLREQGGNREIDWGSMNVDFMFEASAGGSEEITNKADYFASRYVATKNIWKKATAAPTARRTAIPGVNTGMLFTRRFKR